MLRKSASILIVQPYTMHKMGWMIFLMLTERFVLIYWAQGYLF